MQKQKESKNSTAMTHNKFILWAATMLLALTTSCTESDMLKTEIQQESDKPHNYRLCIDMPVPSHDGHTTRANTEWEDGSQVEFVFYTMFSNNYNSVSGIATYTATKKEWLLETKEAFPSHRTMTDCEVRYYQSQTGSSEDFLTAVYYGTTTYSLDGDQILCGPISLKPTNWRLRFQGKEGDQMVLTSEDLRHSIGISLYAGDSSVALGSLSLTVTSDGYTPYIYGTFVDEDGDNTITVESGGQKYTRTISGTALKPGETGYIVVPTESNYMSEGWTQIKEKYTSADATPLNFGTAADSQYFTVDSNEEWTVTSSDPSWCTVEQNFSSNTVKVTVTENTSTSERNATITIRGKESGDETEVTVTQIGLAPHTFASPDALNFTPTSTTQDITVTSNEEWTATSSDTSWCTISSEKGSNDGTVKVTVTKNETEQTNTATVTIKGVTSGDETVVTISQEGITLTVSTPESFEAKGSSQSLTVTCNTEWTVQSADSWCKVEKSESTLKVTAEENTATTERTSKVTVTAGKVTREVTVTQKGKSVSDIDINPFGDDENWD